MTQIDVLEWVKVHGCKVTHQKKNFYRVVNEEGQAMGIPQPREGHENIQPITVCRICTMLKIPVPDYAKQAFDHYIELQKSHSSK